MSDIKRLEIEIIHSMTCYSNEEKDKNDAIELLAEYKKAIEEPLQAQNKKLMEFVRKCVFW